MIPEHLLAAWREVEAIADANPRKGLKAAAKWGAQLAEYDMAQEREEITVQRVARKAVAA